MIFVIFIFWPQLVQRLVTSHVSFRYNILLTHISIGKATYWCSFVAQKYCFYILILNIYFLPNNPPNNPPKLKFILGFGFSFCRGITAVVLSVPPSQDQVIHILLHPLQWTLNMVDVGTILQLVLPAHSFLAWIKDPLYCISNLLNKYLPISLLIPILVTIKRHVSELVTRPSGIDKYQKTCISISKYLVGGWWIFSM